MRREYIVDGIDMIYFKIINNFQGLKLILSIRIFESLRYMYMIDMYNIHNTPRTS